MMKTLQECKDEVAAQVSYNSFQAIIDDTENEIALEILHLAAELYASQFKQLNAELLVACKTVVQEYEGDGMEQMWERIKYFIKFVRKQSPKQNSLT